MPSFNSCGNIDEYLGLFSVFKFEEMIDSLTKSYCRGRERFQPMIFEVLLTLPHNKHVTRIHVQAAGEIFIKTLQGLIEHGKTNVLVKHRKSIYFGQ